MLGTSLGGEMFFVFWGVLWKPNSQSPDITLSLDNLLEVFHPGGFFLLAGLRRCGNFCGLVAQFSRAQTGRIRGNRESVGNCDGPFQQDARTWYLRATRLLYAFFVSETAG